MISEETIAILKDIIQDENPEKKDRFYDKVLPVAKLYTK